MTRKSVLAKKNIRTVALSVVGQMREGGMYLRAVHATAETEQDGAAWTAEYAVTMNGSVVVTLQRKDSEEWTTYLLSAEGIMRAVCDHHFATPTEQPS